MRLPKHHHANCDQRSTFYVKRARARACVLCVLKPDLTSSAEVLCLSTCVDISSTEVRLKRNTVHQIVTSSRRHRRACGHSQNYNALRGYTIHSRSYLVSLYQMSTPMGTKVSCTLPRVLDCIVIIFLVCILYCGCFNWFCNMCVCVCVWVCNVWVCLCVCVGGGL